MPKCVESKYFSIVSNKYCIHKYLIVYRECDNFKVMEDKSVSWHISVTSHLCAMTHLRYNKEIRMVERYKEKTICIICVISYNKKFYIGIFQR